MASVPNKSQTGAHNCGDKNCPKNGPNGAIMMRNPSKSTATSCSDKNCPKHRNGTPSSSNQNLALKANSAHPSVNDAAKASSQEAAANLASLTGPEIPDFNMEELVQNVQTKLRIAVSKPPAGGSNNVMTFITNNNNSVESPFVAASTTPSVSPVKSEASTDRLRTSSCSGIYDQMRMEHTMKENAILQSITIKQGEEIQDLKDKVQELQDKVDKVEQEKMRFLEKAKNYRKVSQDLDAKVKGYEETVKNLKSKLHYTDLKAKQLKRMASENATTASKWRAKVMESLEAQKELEEKKNAYDKAALGLYRQFREEKKKIIDLKRRHGDPITESDFDDTISTTDGTLNTTMLEAGSSPLSSTPK